MSCFSYGQTKVGKHFNEKGKLLHSLNGEIVHSVAINILQFINDQNF